MKSDSPKLPPLPGAWKPKANPQVIYTRNLNCMEISQEQLMTDTLPTNYLYSKINVGEEAAHFFTGTMLGADFDLRLREQFKKGFESLLSANPADAKAVTAAQLECLSVMRVYDMLADEITQAQSAKEQLNADIMDDEQGE